MPITYKTLVLADHKKHNDAWRYAIWANCPVNSFGLNTLNGENLKDCSTNLMREFAEWNDPNGEWEDATREDLIETLGYWQTANGILATGAIKAKS